MEFSYGLKKSYFGPLEFVESFAKKVEQDYYICYFNPLGYIEFFMSFDSSGPVDLFSSWFVGGLLGFVWTIMVRWNPLNFFWRRCSLFVICLLFVDIGYTPR